MKTPDPKHTPRSRSGLFSRAARSTRGFTIIELMIVVAIMGILLAVGVPSFRSMVITMRIKNASFDVYSSLLAARSEAMTRNTTVTITPTAGTNWAAGWATTAGGVAVKTQNAFPGITITGPATLAYNSSGRTTATSISLNATSAFPQDGRCVTVDLSGRPVTTKGIC